MLIQGTPESIFISFSIGHVTENISRKIQYIFHQISGSPAQGHRGGPGDRRRGSQAAPRRRRREG